MTKRRAPARATPASLRHLLVFLRPWLRQERRTVAGAVAALLAGVVLALAEPLPLKLVLDRLTAKPNASPHTPSFVHDLAPGTLIAIAAGLVLALTGLRALAEYHEQIGFAKVANRVLRQVRNHVFLHVQRLSLSFHDKARSGDLLVRVTRDVSLLRDVVSTALLPLLGSMLVLVGMVGVMLWLHWQMTLLAAATVPLFLLFSIRINKRIHTAAQDQREREGAMAATAAESIGAIQVVQAFGLESAFADDFANRNQQSLREEMKSARLSARLGRGVDVLYAVATALVLGYGAQQVMHSRLSTGDLVVFLTYLRRAFNPAKDFAKYSARLAKASAAGERVLALLERDPEIADAPHAIAAPRLRGHVQFAAVHFAYEPKQVVLRGLDLDVPPGTLLALVGPSGFGKSTIIRLLLRFYDPTSGSVRIDGRDVRDYTLASLRHQIGVVLQESVLFSGTLRENIACGAPDVDQGRIEAAARLANAHEFITALPAGYDTDVGERGVTLSQGQRQRIAIARAAIRDAPILVLDEPTSSLDAENATAVGDALLRLAKGRTTFLITHDAGLAARADLVATLEHGGIVVTAKTNETAHAR